MQQLGMPAGLCNALCFQWNHQRRLLQWQQDILARPLETAVAIPQGDALSPLALGVYMYAGLRFVEVQTPENAQQRQRSIYMDDRTWTCSSPALLMQTLRSCETFSNSIGLQENPEKTQLVGSSQYRRRRLKEELADQRLLAEKVSSSALVLGCSTGKAHCIQKKEKQRIEAAKALYARQSILPVKQRTKLNDQRSLGVSKAAYGWVANTSPQSHSTDHDKMARKASRPFTQVAINLHNLQVVIGTRQVLLWLKRKCMESWTWQQDRASQIAQEARQWLTDRGWEQIRQGWHHPVLGKELHTAFAQGERWIPVTAKSIAHLCREGWRTQQWEEFLHSGRRESRILGLWPYDEVRFSHVRKIAQETQGAALAILYGAVLYGAVSPACFGLRP